MYGDGAADTGPSPPRLTRTAGSALDPDPSKWLSGVSRGRRVMVAGVAAEAAAAAAIRRSRSASDTAFTAARRAVTASMTWAASGMPGAVARDVAAHAKDASTLACPI